MSVLFREGFPSNGWHQNPYMPKCIPLRVTCKYFTNSVVDPEKIQRDEGLRSKAGPFPSKWECICVYCRSIIVEIAIFIFRKIDKERLKPPVIYNACISRDSYLSSTNFKNCKKNKETVLLSTPDCWFVSESWEAWCIMRYNFSSSKLIRIRWGCSWHGFYNIQCTLCSNFYFQVVVWHCFMGNRHIR